VEDHIGIHDVNPSEGHIVHSIKEWWKHFCLKVRAILSPCLFLGMFEKKSSCLPNHSSAVEMVVVKIKEEARGYGPWPGPKRWII
jgi:hypothetical protein